MTPDELEVERTALLAEIDALPPGTTLSDEQTARLQVIAEAHAAAGRRIDPIAQAFGEAVAEAQAMSDRDLPPGIRARVVEGSDFIEAVAADGAIVTRVSRAWLAQRAGEIAAEGE